jgi:outer membrane protein assembly factor BamB
MTFGESQLGVNNVSDLKLKWQNPLGGAEPVVANGTVYSSCAPGICALNASTGAKLWSYAIGGGDVTGSAAVENGVVYFGSEVPCHTTACSPTGGTVYALNASTGALLWSFQKAGSPYADEGPFGAPAVANGVVHIGSEGTNVPVPDFVPIPGNLYALNASTGAELWSYKREI